jgi:hypothetical protein
MFQVAKARGDDQWDAATLGQCHAYHDVPTMASQAVSK